MFFLGHISDIHLGPLPKPTFKQLIGKRITGYINWKKHRRSEHSSNTLDALMRELHFRGPDHIALTGDLVNLSLPEEFSRARQWLLNQAKPEDLSLVFGNHDAYVRGSLYTACRTFAPWLSTEVSWEKEAGGYRYRNSPFTDPRPNHTFPYLRIRNNIAIIGASSALATPPFLATGYFGQGQAARLIRLGEFCRQENLFTIVLIHHPPLFDAASSYKRLWGIRRFQTAVAASGAHLVLHGHTHLPTLESIERDGRSIPVVGVSSASQGFYGGGAPASFNWFSIDYYDKQWQVVLSRYAIIDSDNQVRCVETKKLALY